MNFKKTAMTYCCYAVCKARFCPSSLCILSVHLNLIPEPARSFQLLNPKKDQKGIFDKILLVVIP